MIDSRQEESGSGCDSRKALLQEFASRHPDGRVTEAFDALDRVIFAFDYDGLVT
jgi:hypothetical protein